MNLSVAVLSKLAVALLFGNALALSRTGWTQEVTNQIDEGTLNSLPLDLWKRRPAKFFEDKRNVEHIITLIAGRDSKTQRPKSHSKAVEYVKLLTEEQLSKMHSDNCTLVVEFLHHVKNPEKVTEECRQAYISELANGGEAKIRLETVTGIPTKWVKEAGEELLEAMNSFQEFHKGKSVYALLPLDSFKEIQRSEHCGMLRAFDLAGFSDEQLKSLNPECISEIQNMRDIGLGKVMSKLPEKAFSKYNGALNISSLKRMTGPQLASFASELRKDGLICEELEVEHVGRTVIESISKECLHGTLTRGVELKSLWKNIPAEKLRDWTNEMMEVFAKIPASDYLQMTSEVIQFIFDSKLALENMGNETGIAVSLKAHSCTITAEAFAELVKKQPSFAGQILIHFNVVPDDILSLVEADDFLKLTAVKKNGTELNGIEVVAAMKGQANRPNFKAIVQSMGEKAQTHFCSTISSPDQFLEEMLWLRPNASKKCVESLEFIKDTEFYARAPEFATDADAWKEVVEHLRENSWSGLTNGLLAMLVEKPEFCESLNGENKDLVAKLTTENLKVVQDICVFAIKEQITEEMASKLAPNAFALFTEIKFPLPALTPEQISNLSAKLVPAGSAPTDEQAKSHAFSKFTAEDILALDEARFDAITAVQFAVMSPVVIAKVMSAEKLPTIKPAKLVLLSDKHLDSMPTDSLLKLSEGQIMSLGSESKATLAALEKVAAKMDAAQTAAYASRKPKAMATTEEGSWFWWIVGFFAIALIAGIVFFAVRK